MSVTLTTMDFITGGINGGVENSGFIKDKLKHLPQLGP